MADKIDKIPEAARWEMATKGLTGAYGAVESLNPDFTFKLTKNMVRGDAHCEWVVERKK